MAHFPSSTVSGAQVGDHLGPEVISHGRVSQYLYNECFHPRLHHGRISLTGQGRKKKKSENQSFLLGPLYFRTTDLKRALKKTHGLFSFQKQPDFLVRLDARFPCTLRCSGEEEKKKEPLSVLYLVCRNKAKVREPVRGVPDVALSR